MAVTFVEVAEVLLGREPVTGQDFADVGLSIMGGCAVCGESLAAYNGYPGKGGYWLCGDHIGDTGWEDAQEAARELFEEGVE